MAKNIFHGGKELLYSKQANILSAAAVIMVMVLASRLLGLVRNRTFVHFFPPEKLDSFLAAFQLPDLIFEVLVLGAMSSAFIPVFSSYISREKKKEAWYLAGLTLNVLLLFFLVVSIFIFIFAPQIYTVVAQGFSSEQIAQTVSFTRILLLAQMFFAASYVLTATLESNQRFFAPAVAPLFYNLGIIFATILFAPQIGLLAPVFGAVLGSALHLLIQLPLALSLGFRPVFSLDFKDKALLSVAKLALPRILELSFFQIKRLADLFMASLIAGGLTYFKFAESLSALPVGLFGLSIAKASLPQLSHQVATSQMKSFKETFASSFKEILFLIVPAAVLLAVLRIPFVRLAFGARQFEWQDTVQTGYALSAFALGTFAYSLSLLISRAFYALQDTGTPVKVSLFKILLNVVLGLVLVLGLGLPIWGLAFSYALAGIAENIALFALLRRKIGGFSGFGLGTAFIKITFAASLSGGVMFFLLRILDRSAWDKKLSFLGKLGLALPTTFDKFVLDTRYTVNLIVLTAVVAFLGLATYAFLVWLLRVPELGIVTRALQRLLRVRFAGVRPAVKEGEPVSPPYTNGTS
ncbi:MAG: murein biosynthesis integral membrane protein MurJ [Candidatus Blackburnbacteria bacterium]|nr:murein biosynthesis integral membrane protein MurJ [Candidatus Blackburnbacteria bacterium]